MRVLGTRDDQQAAAWQRMVQPLLQLTRQRRVHRRQVGKFVQAQHPAPLLQREGFEQFRPGLGDQLGFELRAEAGEHLLNLQAALRFDGLAVQAVAGLKPLPQPPGLAHAPPAEHHQQPAALHRRVQFAQLRVPVDEDPVHGPRFARRLDARQTLCLPDIMLAESPRHRPALRDGDVRTGASPKSGQV